MRPTIAESIASHIVYRGHHTLALAGSVLEGHLLYFRMRSMLEVRGVLYRSMLEVRVLDFRIGRIGQMSEAAKGPAETKQLK